MKAKSQKLYTLTQVGEILGFSGRSIRDFVQAGLIHAYPNPTWRVVTEKELRRVMREGLDTSHVTARLAAERDSRRRAAKKRGATPATAKKRGLRSESAATAKTRGKGKATAATAKTRVKRKATTAVAKKQPMRAAARKAAKKKTR